MQKQKISFEDLLKSGDILPEEDNFKGEVFKDQPRRFDFTVLILSVITVVCVTITLCYFYLISEPIDDSVVMNNSKVESGISVSSKVSADKININTADIDRLCELKHIGEARAMNIISYRMANGNFEKIEDILEVSGIGEGIFEDIKDKICV